MANEKVSQLNELTAAEISPEDIFLVGDMNAKESKRMTSAQLLLFVESSGSFFPANAINADTASYILGSNVHGNVASASYVSSTISSSFAQRTISSSYADTASYVNINITSVATASYLKYTGVPNGTASYALQTNSANNASQSAFLVYTGINNGTSSFSISSSISTKSNQSTSSSYALSSSYATSATQADAAVFATSASSIATASYSLATKTVIGPKFIAAPLIIPGSVSSIAWNTVNATTYGVNVNATAVILETYFETGDGPIVMSFRKNSGSYALTAAGGALSGGDKLYLINQQTVPLDTGAKFDYKIVSDNSTYIKVIGYY